MYHVDKTGGHAAARTSTNVHARCEFILGDREPASSVNSYCAARAACACLSVLVRAVPCCRVPSAAGVKFRTETGTRTRTAHSTGTCAAGTGDERHSTTEKANAANTRTRSARTHHKQGPTPHRAVETAKCTN
eukprot:2855801-Prymnesium_polylepis.1